MIQTERLLLRPVQSSDLAAYIDLFSQEQVFTHFGKGVQSEDDVRESLIRNLNRWRDNKLGNFAICLNDNVIGRIMCHPNTDGIFELGYVLHPNFWGHSYAKEACQAVLAYVFQTHSPSEIFACARLENEKSKAILRYLGFKEAHRVTGEDKIIRVWYRL